MRKQASTTELLVRKPTSQALEDFKWTITAFTGQCADIVDSASPMFCPECRAEYRPGFTRCSDCDVDLVSELSESDIDAEKLKRVWTGKDQARCAAICKGFREAGIPFKVDQHRQQYLQAVDEQYTIGVPAKFFEKARKAVKANLDFPD